MNELICLKMGEWKSTKCRKPSATQIHSFLLFLMGRKDEFDLLRLMRPSAERNSLILIEWK